MTCAPHVGLPAPSRGIAGLAMRVIAVIALALAAAPALASAAPGSDVRGGLHRSGRWLVDDEGHVIVMHGSTSCASCRRWRGSG